MKATLSNYTQSPRKVRLVTDMVKGKSVPEALTLLTFEMRKSAEPLKKLIQSAVANAEQKGESVADLVVKNIRVDSGIVLKRFRARARGQAAAIRKRRAHVTVELGKK